MKTFRTFAAAAALALAAPLAASAASLPAVPAAEASFEAGSLHVDRFGKGDAIVLLPGLTTGTWEWADTIRHLAPSHTVYAVSLPASTAAPRRRPRSSIGSRTTFGRSSTSRKSRGRS